MSASSPPAYAGGERIEETLTMNCAHCGGAATGTELYCPSCGRAFIPDWSRPDPAPALATGRVAATSQSRGWALAAHATAMAGAMMGGVAAFVGPLVIWLVRRDDPFAAEHARQALNFNLSVLLYVVVGSVVAVIVTVLTLGLALIALLPALAVAFVAYFAVSVVGALAASRGRQFRYPLALPLVR
jgi:uncharacterized Tic20 family protein